MAPDLDAVQMHDQSQTIQLVGPSMGSGSGVEVPIPTAGPSTPTRAARASPSPGPSGTSKLDQPPPSISITRASAPAPLLLPTQSDIVPATAERGFAADDVEAGMGMGMDSREAVPLREIIREDSIDSVASERTAVGPKAGSNSTTPTTPVGLGINIPPVSKFGQDASVIVAEPSLMDSLGTPGEASEDAVTLTPTPVSPVAPALVPVPTFESAETASVDGKEDDAESDGEAPPTTIRLVGGKGGMVSGTTEPEPAVPAKVRASGRATPQLADSDNDSRTSLDLTKEEREERKKKRFSKGLAKLGLKGGKRKEESVV